MASCNFIFTKISSAQRAVQGYGESGIRTHGDISATLDFESSALDQLSHLSFELQRAYSALSRLLCQDLS